MEPIILKSRECKECETARSVLEEHGYKYREVSSRTPEGMELVKKYSTHLMPCIIDKESEVAFSVSDFYRYLDMVNKEYQ